MKTFRILIMIAAIALMALSASAESDSGGQAAQPSSNSTGGQAAQPQKANPAGGQASQSKGAANPANSLPFRGPPEAENPRPYFPTDDLKSSTTPAAHDNAHDDKEKKPDAKPAS